MALNFLINLNMGKKDDWCSSKGLNNRKKGMYEKESKGKKVCYCVLFGFSALFCFGVGGLYAARSINSTRINTDYEVDAVLNNVDKIS